MLKNDILFPLLRKFKSKAPVDISCNLLCTGRCCLEVVWPFLTSHIHTSCVKRLMRKTQEALFCSPCRSQPVMRSDEERGHAHHKG